MRYITLDDLTADSYERFINESSADIPNTLDKNEARAIGLVKTYLERYDTGSIFGSLIEANEDEEDEEPEYTPPIRHELLVEIICKITLRKVFGRNAARKVPEDVQKDYDWAIKELERIRNGSVNLGLPPAIDESGGTTSNSMWGNNTNTDYYI